MLDSSSRTLTVQKTGTGQGTVQSAPNGINCGKTCSVTAPPGTTFVLTATPAQGSVFTGWTGCTSVNAQNQCSVTLNQSITVTANFAATFPLTVTETGGGEGTVTSNPAGINCGVPGGSCTANVASGVEIQLTATPAAGSNFVAWTGVPIPTAPSASSRSPRATQVTAEFQLAAVQAAVTGNKTTCTGPKNFRRQLKITIDADQGITVVIRLRNSNGTIVQRKPVVGTADLFQVTMNIPNSRPNGKYKAQVTMTNQFGTQKVQNRNVKLKTC